MEYTIDAKGKKLGRVAQEAASILMGKNTPDFERQNLSGNKVTIENASQADISDKQMEEKEYEKYSGYPGGLVFEKMKRVVEKKGYSEIFRMAVRGMLPANRIAEKMMKNLIVKE
ncbi:MAG: 50S ribosomal protein L13 [Bacteroidetes bacterium]|nr:50S ribosomal protein L13 [Bacteroidota bacterium]